MKPFLLLSIRAEKPAADDEYAAFCRFLSVDGSGLMRRQLGVDPLDDLVLDDWSGIILGGGSFTFSDPEESKAPVQRRAEGDLDRPAGQGRRGRLPFPGRLLRHRLAGIAPGRPGGPPLPRAGGAAVGDGHRRRPGRPAVRRRTPRLRGVRRAQGGLVGAAGPRRAAGDLAPRARCRRSGSGATSTPPSSTPSSTAPASTPGSTSTHVRLLRPQRGGRPACRLGHGRCDSSHDVAGQLPGSVLAVTAAAFGLPFGHQRQLFGADSCRW